MNRTAVLSQVRLSFLLAILFLTFLAIGISAVNALTLISNNEPIIKDPDLKAEEVFKGLAFPTSMAFLGPNDILVFEKKTMVLYRGL